MTYNRYNTNLYMQSSSEDDDEDYWNDSIFSRQRQQQNTKPQISKTAIAANPQTNAPQQSADNLEQIRNQLLGGDDVRSSHKATCGVKSNGVLEEENNSAKRLEQLKEQILASQQRSVVSSEKTLQLMQESESVGIETANELTRQGEQLQRAERGLDDINRELNTSKRYIRSMKSWFGPVKNYFSYSTNEGTAKRDDRNASRSNQPIRNAAIPSSSSNARDEGNFSLFTNAQMSDWSDTMKENERKCNQNLETMSSGLDRLKLLASGLGQELDQQNEALDRMNYKAEGSNIKINKQHADLKDLLK